MGPSGREVKTTPQSGGDAGTVPHLRQQGEWCQPWPVECPCCAANPAIRWAAVPTAAAAWVQGLLQGRARELGRGQGQGQEQQR